MSKNAYAAKQRNLSVITGNMKIKKSDFSFANILLMETHLVDILILKKLWLQVQLLESVETYPRIM